ncbi:hypothetical protein KJ841_02925 [Patescibacteria group bacterium]|nr:hypothetical protein [Patescibacteria group bacterium]
MPSRGGFAYYGRDRSTLGEVLDCVGSGMNVLGGLNQMSVTNRLVDHQISVDNRMVSMAERDQDLRDQQIRAQARTQRKTVLVITDPVIYVPAGCRVKEEPEKTQENEKLRQEVEVKKESKDERLLEIISELKSYKGAYCEYLQKRHENKSPEDALKAALEKLKDSDEEAYYKLLEKMYDCGN